MSNHERPVRRHEKHFGLTASARNWNTLKKIAGSFSWPLGILLASQCRSSTSQPMPGAWANRWSEVSSVAPIASARVT